MNLHNRNAVIGAAIALFFCLSLAGTTVKSQGPQITQTRTITEKSFHGKNPEPLRIVSYSFGEGEDWLKDLVIEVENISAKPIYFIDYTGFLPKLEGMEHRIAIHFYYNRDLRSAAMGKKDVTNSGASPMPPRGKVKLPFPETEYESLKQGVAKLGVSLSAVKKVEFIIQHAYYGDGTGWLGGLEYSKPEEQQLNSKESPNTPQQSRYDITKLQVLKASWFAVKPFQCSGTCNGICGNWRSTPCQRTACCNDTVDDYNYALIDNLGTSSPDTFSTPCPYHEGCLTQFYQECLLDICV